MSGTYPLCPKTVFGRAGKSATGCRERCASHKQVRGTPERVATRFATSTHADARWQLEGGWASLPLAFVGDCCTVPALPARASCVSLLSRIGTSGLHFQSRLQWCLPRSAGRQPRTCADRSADS
eukprot:1571228-Pleurochrysis_carterae.AAC.3